MSPAPRRPKPDQTKSAAAALLGAAPLITRWMERLLAQHDPALTASQYLALRAIAEEQLTAAELAHRAGVSGPAVSQLLAGLASGGWVPARASVSGPSQSGALAHPEGELVLASVERSLTARLGELIARRHRPSWMR